MTTAPSFLDQLNPAQKQAAEVLDGPLIVLAGAGSGKTKMLTARIANLIFNKKARPQEILAMTFTNKAAAEMKRRVDNILSDDYGSYLGQPDIGTFHSVCIKLLRREQAHLPFSGPFVVFDDSDQRSLIKTVMKNLDIDIKKFNPKTIQQSINQFKCDATEPNEVEESNDRYQEVLRKVYRVYQKELYAHNAVDFGEIITMTYRLLRDFPEVRKKYQNYYKYIHVDEYQDTNRAQYLLLSTLVQTKFGGHQNICVVGDEDQSIYGWRGADISNILDFEIDFPQAAVFKLEQNYRSTKNIIEAASQVIQNNKTRKKKILWTENSDGSKINRIRHSDERQEAQSTISEIQRLYTNEKIDYNNIAIFYRTHAQSRQFEDALRASQIPYQIVGGVKFYERKEIKDIMSYLRVIFNSNDSVSVKRIINTPARGIGKVTVERLDAHAYESTLNGSDQSFWQVIQSEVEDSKLFGAGTTKKLAQFSEMILHLQEEALSLSVSDLYHLILDSTHYVTELKRDGSVEALARIENLEEFDSILQEFEEDENQIETRDQLALFLEKSALAQPTDEPFDAAAVKLMTLHSSKGLEFPAVFMVGMEEGLFPSIKPWEETDKEELEEERRLCYVGMTRAEKHLYLSHVDIRRLWGQIHYQDPSRFLGEFSPDLCKTIDLTRTQRIDHIQTSPQQTNGFGEANCEDEVIGQMVNHPQYGQGKVISCEGMGSNKKVTIHFAGHVRKKFLLRYLLPDYAD